MAEARVVHAIQAVGLQNFKAPRLRQALQRLAHRQAEQRVIVGDEQLHFHTPDPRIWVDEIPEYGRAKRSAL